MSNNFECIYCKKKFKTERGVFAHSCKFKTRYKEKDDYVTRVAFHAFKKWYEVNMSISKSFDDFAYSKFYNGFYKFGRFVRDMEVINPHEFVDFLIKHDVELKEWCKEDIYKIYTIELSKKEPAEKALERTIKLFKAWSIRTGNKWNDFFKKVTPHEGVSMIINGRISPWILFSSIKAKYFFERLSDEQIGIINSHIDNKFWSKKFASKSDDKKELESACKTYDF